MITSAYTNCTNCYSNAKQEQLTTWRTCTKCDRRFAINKFKRTNLVREPVQIWPLQSRWLTARKTSPPTGSHAVIGCMGLFPKKRTVTMSNDQSSSLTLGNGYGNARVWHQRVRWRFTKVFIYRLLVLVLVLVC